MSLSSANFSISMDWSLRRLGAIKDMVNAKRYLEIGVQTGKTFLSLNFDEMDAVDPIFAFDYRAASSSSRRFHQVTSDVFFESGLGCSQYDLVFIDGLHTYDQTYRDFCNVLPRLHSKSIVVIDDVLPCDSYSMMRSQEKCIQARVNDSSFKGDNIRAWQGDVCKVLLFLNLFHHEYVYATIPGKDNIQTIVWSRSLERVASMNEESSALSRPFQIFNRPNFVRRALWNLRAVDYQWINENQQIYNFCSEQSLFDYLSKIFLSFSTPPANTVID